MLTFGMARGKGGLTFGYLEGWARFKVNFGLTMQPSGDDRGAHDAYLLESSMISNRWVEGMNEWEMVITFGIDPCSVKQL